MAKRIVIDGPLVVGDMVTLKHGTNSKKLQVLGNNTLGMDAKSLSYSFNQTLLELTVTDPASEGHTALLTGDALIVMDY